MKKLALIWFTLSLCLVEISTIAQPTISANGPLEFCAGESVTLCVEPEYHSYLWCSGSTTQCITVIESGDYCALVVDSLGNVDSTLVDSAITIVVHEPEPIVIQSGASIICVNEFVSYQWFFNGDTIPGATDSVYLPDASGVYVVSVVDEFGCNGSSIYWEFFPAPDGINETNYQPLTIYPNPTTSTINIQLPENNLNATRTRIYDMTGRLVHQQPYNPNMDVSYLDRGTYIVVVETKEGNFRGTVQKQ